MDMKLPQTGCLDASFSGNTLGDVTALLLMATTSCRDTITEVQTEVQTILKAISSMEEFKNNTPCVKKVLDIVKMLLCCQGEVKKSFEKVFLLLKQKV